MIGGICALLGYYVASCVNCLPTFRDNVSVPSSGVKSPCRKERMPATSMNLCYQLLAFFLSYSDSWHMKMGPIHCTKMSVNNCHMMPHNIPEERRSHQHRGGSLKSKFMTGVLSIFTFVNLHFFCQSECVHTLTWECVYCSFLINFVSICTCNPLILFKYYEFSLSLSSSFVLCFSECWINNWAFICS
jgi:hypothetical protein